MELTINTQALVAKLKVLKEGTTVGDSSGYNLLYSDGQHLCTSNEEVFISVAFDLGQEFLINFNDLYGVVSKIKDEEVVVKYTPTELVVCSEHARASFQFFENTIVKERNAAVLECLGNADWKTLPENFNSTLQTASLFIDQQIPVFMLLYVHIEGEDVIAASANTAYWGKLASGESMPEMFIPYKCIKAFKAFAPGEYAVSDNFIHFASGDIILSVRTISGKYPDYRPFFKERGINVALPAEVADHFPVVASMVDAKDSQIQVYTKKNHIYFKAQSRRGKAESKTKLVTDTDFTFLAPANILRNYLSRVTTLVVCENSIRGAIDNGEFVISLASESN